MRGFSQKTAGAFTQSEAGLNQDSDLTQTYFRLYKGTRINNHSACEDEASNQQILGRTWPHRSNHNI